MSLDLDVVIERSSSWIRPWSRLALDSFSARVHMDFFNLLEGQFYQLRNGELATADTG